MKIKDGEGSSASKAAKNHQYLNYHVFTFIYQRKWTHNKFQKPETDKIFIFQFWNINQSKNLSFSDVDVWIYLFKSNWLNIQIRSSAS